VDVEEIIARIMQERANRTLARPQQRIHEIRTARRRMGPVREPLKE